MPMPLFRLFVSSTFADFQLERAILHDTVFPRVARYCERRGATFQPVDLRWGVTDQLAADQQTMQVCLAEIRRCQELSPRPNFLIMLGNRYGWQPLPDWLSDDVYAALSASAAPDERTQLEAAYAVDENALPCAYRLRRADERASVEIDEGPLRRLLERTAASLQADAQQVALVGAATHQEVMLAALGQPTAASGEVVAWLRDFDAVPASVPADWPPADYSPDGLLDKVAGARMAQLKSALKQALPARLLDGATVSLADYRSGGAVVLEAYRKRFAHFVLKRLLHQIRAQLISQRAAQDADPEDAAHRRFGAARRAGLAGRDAEIAAVVSHLSGSARDPVVLTGTGGSGKTSIMAGVAARLRHGVVIERYVGVTPASSSLRALVAALCGQLDRSYRPDAPPVALAEGEPLDVALGARLQLVSKSRPLYLLIDSLDQFPPEDRATLLRWLPARLPRHVRIALSCRDGFPLPARVARLAAPPLAPDVARGLLQDWLGAQGRTLTPPQRAAVEAGYAACPLPLWLRLASELARHWHSDSGTPDLPHDLNGMVTLAIASLRRRHAPVLLTQALACLGASRFGLSELELGRLLAADPAVQAEFDRNSHHPWDIATHGLPPVLWSRLRLDLGPYLVERSVDGALLLAFFHREFTEVVVRDMVAPQAAPMHAALARHFAQAAGPGLPVQAAQGHVAARRRLTEQAYQLAAAGDGAGLAVLLEDFAFVMAKCAPDRLPELLRDYAVLATLAGPDALAPWRDFLGSHAGLLAQADARWPAYKILLQLAQEQAPEHPVAKASDAWLASGACTWRWARRQRRPARVQAPAVLAQFSAPAGEDAPFQQVLEVGGGRIATLGMGGPGAEASHRYDGIVRIWNASSGLIEHELAEHDCGVGDLAVLPGERIATLAEDGVLRIWSTVSGACLAARALTTPHPRALLALDAGRLVVSYGEPARVECLRVDDLAPAAGSTGDIAAWIPIGIDAAHVLLADRIVGEEDYPDDCARYWLWTVDGGGPESAPEPLGARRRLAADDGRTLLWDAGAADVRLLGEATGQRRATLPAPAADARLVAGWGAAVALQDGRIALLPWEEAGIRLLDPGASGWNLAPREDEAVRWGVCAARGDGMLGWCSTRDDGYLAVRWGADGGILAAWNGRGWLAALVPGQGGGVLARYVYREDEGQDDEHPLECWDDETGQVRATMRGHFNYIDHVGWLPDGRVLSWSEDDGTVRTWDAASGAQLALFNLEGFIRRVMPLGDGSLLVNAFGVMFRFNLDFRDEPFVPCGGVQMTDGLALAWDEGGPATLWRTADRQVLSAIANSRDIARVRRCGAHLLAWDRSAREWTLWADGDHRLLATVAAGESQDAEDDAVFLLESEILVSLLPLGGEAFTKVAQDFLLQHHALDNSGPVLEVLLDKPSYAGATAYLLAAHCVALVGEQEVLVYRVDGNGATARHWPQQQKLRFQRALATGLLCCFGSMLSLWDENGELVASRALPEPPVEVLALPGGGICVCLPQGLLELREADLGVCWEHEGAPGFRYRRVTLGADGRLIGESGQQRRAAVEILDRQGKQHHRLALAEAAPEELRPLLQGAALVVFDRQGRWQHWALPGERLCGDYPGVPEYAKEATLEDGGRLLWIRGSEPCLFDLRDGRLLASAQGGRSGLWLVAAPLSDTTQEKLVLLGASAWPAGEQVFWTNARNREVVALSDASGGRMLLKGANWFAGHQHYGFWIQMMHGAQPQHSEPYP